MATDSKIIKSWGLFSCLKDILNLKRYFGKLSLLVNKSGLSKLEALMFSTHRQRALGTTIFLIGPPRSGSTLAYQVFTDAFELGYLSNRHCTCYGWPALVEKIFCPSKRKQPSNYCSYYGQTASPLAPAECGQWWYRFFRRDPAYVTLADVDEKKMYAFQRSLFSLLAACGKSFIFKNLYACLRLEPIAEYVPRALFIVIERDWVDNAQSILNARKDASGSYDPWWSVPPPDVDKLSKLSPVEQVVGQIEAIHDLINKDVHRLGLESRTFRMKYDDFCNDVHGTLHRLEAFMAGHGIELQRRFVVPERFDVNRTIKIPLPMHKMLQEHVAQRLHACCAEKKHK